MYIYIDRHTYSSEGWRVAWVTRAVRGARPCGHFSDTWVSSAGDACSWQMLWVFASRGWTCRGASDFFAGCLAQAWLHVSARGFGFIVDPAFLT